MPIKQQLGSFKFNIFLLSSFLLWGIGCSVPEAQNDIPFRFMPPAFQDDFQQNPAQREQLIQLWNVNLNGFTNQGLTGDPWNATHMADITNYFNPSVTSSKEAAIADIIWGAWPGRIERYYSDLPINDQLAISDTGLKADGSIPPLITNDPCNPTGKIKYGPYGPRGFQDEYSEWSVQRNAAGKITRVDFTCENPEYWNTLWLINPDTVLRIYQRTLDYAKITMDDLVLHDANGKVIIDPSTNRPVYNPLNKWNSGSGGAMHLTSTPNTLQTEIGLATSSTLQRTSGNANEHALLCCGEFGQAFRNSDPHIGGSVNRIVEAGFQVTLTNPPGLYIQMPNFSQYKTPDNTPASQFWTITRGRIKTANEYGDTLPGNYILHAKFEVPASYNYTVGDITIADSLIKWGGQIAQTYNMQIVASALKKSAGPIESCTGTPAQATPAPQQLFHESVFTGMINHNVPNPMQFPMNLLSSSTFIAPKVQRGSTDLDMVLTADEIDPSNGPPVITFDDPAIKATFLKQESITYSVPGNSYPSNSVALFLTVSIGTDAGLGTHSLSLSNAGKKPGPPMPALIHVVSSIQ